MKQTNNVAVRQETSTIDQKTLIFLDVGLWGCPVYDFRNPSTTFGIVCGHHVLLCDWLGRAFPSACNWIPQDRNWWDAQFPPGGYPFPSGAYSLITKANDLQTEDGRPRGHVLDCASSNLELTPPDAPLVIFPDLHLHLYVGTPLDRFQYAPSDDSDEVVSLDGELRDLLDLAEKIGATTVQAGDMYEVWESEILLRLQYIVLYEVCWKGLKAAAGQYLHRTSMENVSTQESPLLYQKRMLDAARMPPPWTSRLNETLNGVEQAIRSGKFRSSLRLILLGGMDWATGLIDWATGKPLLKERLLAALVQNASEFLTEFGDILVAKGEGAVVFDKTDSILEGIRASHEKLFDGEKKLFNVEVRGNHDNRMKNAYWTEDPWRDFVLEKVGGRDLNARFPLFQQFEKKIRSKTLSSTGDENRSDHEQLGSRDRIWVEHGHRYDWNNNDGDEVKPGFSGPDRGFNVVCTSKLLKAMIGDRQEFALWVSRPLQYWFNFEMRNPEFGRTAMLFDSNPDLRLVVMGHTHENLIEEDSMACGFPLSYKDWHKFWGNKYSSVFREILKKKNPDLYDLLKQPLPDLEPIPFPPSPRAGVDGPRDKREPDRVGGDYDRQPGG